MSNVKEFWFNSKSSFVSKDSFMIGIAAVLINFIFFMHLKEEKTVSSHYKEALTFCSPSQ